MIEAQLLPERTASLNALLARRKEVAMVAALTSVEAPSRAVVAIPRKTPTSSWAEDLRFFAICYLAGFIFFLIMLT